MLSFFVYASQAQDIQPEVFTNVKGTLKIELPQANRNFEKINFEMKPAPVKPQEYQMEEVEVEVPKMVVKINPVIQKPDPLQKLYGNYVKAGIGNYSTPYFEGFFNNKRSENVSYGLHLKHFSSALGPVKNSKMSENRASAYVRYFTKKTELSSSLSYDRDRYNFYGYDHNFPVEKDTIKQVFNTISFKAGIKSLNQDSKFSYDLRFGYFNFRNRYSAREGEYLTNLGSAYRLDEDKSIRLDGVLSVSGYKDSVKLNRTFFQLKPAFYYDLGKYKLTAGFNTAYISDTANTSKFHLYPRLNVDVSLIENQLTAFAGLEGEMQKNTLRSFISENPFLESNVELRHSNKSIELYAGIKGNYAGLNFKGRLGYANYNNLFFYNNSEQDSSEFRIMYDRSTSVLNLLADVSYDLSDRFRMGLGMNYYSYNLSTLEQPWHRPKFTTSLSAGYNLKNKIYINTDIYYISGLSGKNYISGREVKLDGIFDVNLKIDYKISNAFTAFLELNNILSKKYQRYLYYPVKGINVIGGISYSF